MILMGIFQEETEKNEKFKFFLKKSIDKKKLYIILRYKNKKVARNSSRKG